MEAKGIIVLIATQNCFYRMTSMINTFNFEDKKKSEDNYLN